MTNEYLRNSVILLFFWRTIELGPTDEVFTRPKQQKTEDYVMGRFG